MADETPWTPVGKEPVDDQGWVPVAPPESGYIAGGLRSIYRGLTEIPRAAGDALEYNPEYLASGDSPATRDASKLSFLDKAGKVLSDVSESAKEVVAPAVYGTNEIKRSVFQGVESAPLSLAYKIPGYVGAVAGGALGLETGPGSLLTAAAGAAVAQAPVAAVMYRATAQQNMEDLDKAQSEGLLKPGTTNAQKLATAQAMAHQEWIGESVSDVAENVMFSKLPFLGEAVKSAKGVLTPGLKSFAKTYAGIWVAEQAGEGYTAATQAALKNEILPADQQQTPWEAAKYQAGPTTVMTLLFTGAGHAGSSFKGRGVTKYLEDENTSPDVRFQLASMVASRLKESNGPEVAQNFMDHAADAIANKSTPSRLDLNDPALLTPYKPVDDTPATPLEQSGQDALDALKARVNPDNDIDTTDAAVAHVEEVKSAQTEAELNLQTATENLVKKMATPPPEPVTPETATPETFNPLKVSTTPAEALDYQRATGDTAYEVVRKDGKFVFEKTLETLKAEGYATTPSGNPFQSKAAAEKRIDLEQYEAVPFKKGWVGKPKIFLHQADVHAEELAKTLVEGGIAADDPVYAKIINERRTRERVPDPQTGLIAREHHNPTLERAVKEGRDFGYADVDLTNLGGLNEWAGGIEQANPYMRDIAQILVNTVQSAYPTAQVFRKGGDEFGVIAPGTNSKKLDVVLAKAQEAVKAYTISNGLSEIPHTKKGNPSGVGITYGTADTKGKSSTDVLKIADARTAKSKQALKEAYNVDAKLVGAVEAEPLEGQTQRVVEGVGQDNSGQREAASQVKRPEPATPETVSKPEAEAAFNKEYTARLLKGDFAGAFEGRSDDMIDEYAADPANQAVFNMDAEDLAEHLTTLADGIKERASKNVKFAVKGNEDVSADKRGLSDGVLRGDAGVGDQGTRSVATQGVEKGSPDTVEGRTLVEASIKRSIAAHVGTTPEAVQLSLVSNVGDYKVANSIARLFGKYVYTADTAGDASLGDAFVSGNHPDAIFISKNTDKPVLTLLGHELLHKLAAEHSELYNKFKLYIEAINKSGVAEKYKAELKKISQYSTLDDTGITEEYLGNVVGHMFVQQSFWEKLARTEPNLFARILNMLRDMLQTIKSNFQGAASTLKDVNEVETVTAKVFAKYARLYSEGKFSVDVAGNILFSASEEAKPWYSKLEQLFSERLKSVNQEKTLPRSHFESILKDKNLKADEIKASGIEEFLKTKERFTAKEVQDELKANAVQLHDVVLGEPSFEPWSVYDSQDRFVKSVDSKDKAQALANEIGGNIAAPNGTVEPPPTHFSQYQEPGSVGGSYREMFVTAPSNKTDFKYKENGEPVFDSQGNAVREPVNTWQDGHSQYSDIQNPVVRIRFNEREVDGKRILFVEEMQGPSDTEQKKMPDYLSKRIYDLGVKRVLSYAKENGFDGVAWTPGETQAKRYDLSKEINQVQWSNEGGGDKRITIDTKAGNGETLTVDDSGLVRSGSSAFRGKQLDEVIGKDLAKQIVEKDSGTLSGLDLKVGGEGLKSLYDKTLPSLFKKYGKEAVGELDLGGEAGKVFAWETTEDGKHQLYDNDNTLYEIRPTVDADGAQTWTLFEKMMGENFQKIDYEYGLDTVKEQVERSLSSEAGEPLGTGVGKAPYIPITAATPSSQTKFSAGAVGISSAGDVGISSAGDVGRFSGGKNVTTNKGVAGDTNFHLRPASERLAAINGAVEYPDGSKIPQGSLKVSKNSTLQNQLSKIAGVFGHDVTLVADFPGRRGDGFWYSADTKHVYIYETSADKPLAVLGHELVHHMQTQDNALYKELGAGFFALRDNAGMNKYLDRYFPGVDKSSVPKNVTEEWVGDVLGRSMGDQGFWDAFEKASPSLAARVAKFIHELIQKVKGKLFSGRIAGSARTVKDFKAVDKLAADVMTRYASRLEKAAASGDLQAVKELSAFHGSPHDFDKFSTQNIGTGEGVQAYGYGLYFAGSKDVAEYYKKVLSGDGKSILMVGDVPLSAVAGEPQRYAASYLAVTKGDATGAIDRINEEVRDNPYIDKTLAEKALKWLEDVKDTIHLKPPGRLYHVELAPAEDEYLLWDKPLAEQSEKVKAALKPVIDFLVDSNENPVGDERGNLMSTMKGERLYNGDEIWKSLDDAGAMTFDGDKSVSEYLHSLGIRGIKYADGVTRNKEEQSFNYVIFHEDDVSISMKFSAGDVGRFSAGDVGRFSASLNDPIKAAKGLNDFFKKIPYSQIATDAANKIYRFVIPVDRQVTLNASQKTYAPIKSLLNQFIRQRKEKAGRIQSDMTDGAHIWKRFEKQFKTDAEVQNFSDMVWNATEYELHADSAIASPWTDVSWEKAGMLKRTGKTLEEAQKIVSDQYQKLTPEQKTVHLEMLHHIQQMYQAGRQAELAWLDPAKVKEAEAWLQDEVGNTFNKVEKPELVDLVKDIDEHYPTLRGDYMPMMRFGDLIVRTYETDKNGELGARTRTDFFDSPEDARKFIEAVNSNNTSYQNELKAAGDDVAAQAAVREKYKDYNLKHAKIETNPEYRKDVVNIPASLVDKISKAAANQGITGDALEELKQSIEGIRANLLPRTSTKGSKLHREGVAGYERDVVRVYLTYVRNHALANAQLTHGAKIEQTFRDMRNKIDAVASEPDYDVDAVRRMGELADHLYGVEKAGSREKVNEFTKTVGKITFAWYLASPSVFAVQWSQPFMVTIPKMGARHGYGKAFAAYTKAAKQYLHGEFSDDKIDEFDRKHEYVGQRVTDILDRARDARGAERVQLDKELKEIYNSFGGAEKRLLILKVLSHQGQIDLAMSHNAADVVAGATADTKALNWIVDKGAFFMQKSETGSRRAAAISAFELQFNGNNFTEANDYATHIISDTLMDFDAQNRGAAWRGNTGRIIGQFQFFRMHMVGKLAQLTKDAIGGEYKRAMAEATTQEEKDAAMKAMKEARKEFAYVMGSSFALAGAMGTPLAVLMGNTGMSAIWAALAAVFGDDDDPWDPKRDFELAVREALGDTFGNVVLKGLPSLIGADLSRRIGLGGMGDIIQGDPPAGLTPTAKANWYAGRILGPSWGVISDTIRSADALADGDLAGAFKAGSPKIMRDVAKMFGVADKGVEAGGKTILKPEDVSVWSMALMFSGINPMEVALASEESRYLKNISTELSQRRSMLIKHLAEATVDQDLDAKDAAIEKINKFSETQPMLKITQQELFRKIKKIRDGREGKLSKRELLVQEEFGKK